MFNNIEYGVKRIHFLYQTFVVDSGTFLDSVLFLVEKYPHAFLISFN